MPEEITSATGRLGEIVEAHGVRETNKIKRQDSGGSSPELTRQTFIEAFGGCVSAFGWSLGRRQIPAVTPGTKRSPGP